MSSSRLQCQIGVIAFKDTIGKDAILFWDDSLGVAGRGEGVGVGGHE